MIKAIVFLLFGGLCGCQPASRYVVHGDMDDFSGKAVLLSPNENDGLDTLGTAVVREGKFCLEGAVEKTVFAWLRVDKMKLNIPLFLENTSFSVRVKTDGLTVSGGKLQQIYERFKENVENKVKRERDSLERKYEEYRKEGNLFGKYHIRALAVKLDSLYEQQENEFITGNDNIVSAGLIYTRLSVLVKKKFLRGKYELLGDTARNSDLGKILAEYVGNEVDLRKGALFPDFTLQTPQGESVSLYSVKAKVKIVDFWASWCGPCRAENPNVKKLYEKYHDLGLEVVGVSLDHKKDRWQKAIEQDILPWIHVSDLRAWEGPLVKALGIRGIPYLVVLDENNRIVGIKLRGEELERCVVEVMQ